MVHKTTHRGVHSGNTLRAFNSRFSRRYHNQACIVSRVRPALLKKLIGDKEKNSSKHNIAVGVALSLNKQYRWMMPAALTRQIQSNDITQSELTVSLLERHKLKRPASCISFHSNKGEVKRIQPRGGRYFSFNFQRTDGKSRRAIKREWRQSAPGELKQSKVRTGKVVTVYTEQGRAHGALEIGESEVRYEVFYPSPAHSSISHNPKYIKQDTNVAPGSDAEHVQHGKPKKQHRGKRRKRMTLKDIDDCDLPAYNTHYDPGLTFSVNDTIDTEDFAVTGNSREEYKTTECLLTSLIEKSEQLQSLVGKQRRRKKSAKLCSQHDQKDEKSHIVYLPTTQEEDIPNDNVQSLPSVQSVSPSPSGSTRVLLPVADVTTRSLNDCFGENYHEAACRPRKFVLDITSYVRELLKKQGIQVQVAENIGDALSYLICIHDGFYDNEYDVYKVLLNSKLHHGLLDVKINPENHQDLFRGTVMNLISYAMDFLQGEVIRLKEQNHFPSIWKRSCHTKSERRQINHHLISADAYIPSVQRVFQKGSAVSDIDKPLISDMLLDDPLFCDICYDEISPLVQGSAASTALLKCNHRVCDNCWSQHINSRLHQGFVRVTCPGFDCQEDVQLGVLLSVANLDTVEKLLQRQEEVRIGASLTEKWCPNKSCGRVISLPPAWSCQEHPPQQDVRCACGTNVCFQCLMPAHWPASCKQAEEYRTSLSTKVFPDRLAEVHDDSKTEQEAKIERMEEKKTTMVVEGKHCPKCKSFVYKNGGCPQMVCRCGQLFCWFCARPGYSHPNRRNCVDVTQEKKLTTTIVVHHLDRDESMEGKNNEEALKTANRRQRISLMERAVEHRQHHLQKGQRVLTINSLAKAVSAAASKDATLAQQIIDICSGTCPSSLTDHTQSSLASRRSWLSPVQEQVTSFLKNAAQTKKELHEVVEYSLVLLKDLPDSLLRQRALRITDDLGAFCCFIQSVFDAWNKNICTQTGHSQQAVKAVMRLAEIQRWIRSALATHVVTMKKMRSAASSTQ